MIRHHARLLINSSMFALAVAVSPALAQPAASGAASPAGGDKVEEVVVTAQFRAQDLQRTPLSITAVSDAMLKARSETNISQVADQAPSVTLRQQGAAYGPSMVASIRGVGQFDFNPALEPGVGLYIDDVYYATLTGSLFDLLDLDRVEILRGPQGTLAGKNSIGGAIKLYTKKPNAEEGGYLTATYGSDNRIDVRGSADFKIADRLFMRVAAVSKRQDGYIDRLDFGCVYPAGSSSVNPANGVPRQRAVGEGCLLAKDGNTNYQGVRAQIRWLPTEDLEINLAADYTHEDQHTAGGVLTYANYAGSHDIDPYGAPIPYDSRFMCGKYCNYATFESPADGASPDSKSEDRVTYNGYGLSATIDWQIDNRTSLKSITAYRRYDTFFGNDDDFSPMANSLGRSTVRFHSVSQEVRLNGSFGDTAQLEYTVGGFYMDQRSVYLSYQDIRYGGLLPFIQNDPVPADTKAAFAQLMYHITDDLTATGGLRYTQESKEYTFSRLNPDGTVYPLLASLNGLTGNYSGHQLDYRANLQYQFTPNVMAYAQVSTGFKGGGINPRPFNFAQVQPFTPEKLTSYEVGAKTEFWDGRARLNVSAYYSDYKDIQLQLNSCPQFGGPGPCAMIANAGDANIKGVELETTLRPVDGLLFDGSLSYLKFAYSSINPQAGGPAGVQLGYVPPYVPSWKWSFGVQYEFPLADVGSLTPRFDMSYQSHVYATAVNGPTNRLPGYALANARLTYRTPQKDWSVSLEVTNLFNKYYFLSGQDQSGVGAGYANAVPGRPREYAVTLTKSF